MYKNILFDIDGTIVDTEKSIIYSLQKVLLEEFNMKKEYDELKFVLGIPGIYSLEKMNIPKDRIDEIAGKWSNYISTYQDEVKLYPNIESVISYLAQKNINLGIVTSKDDDEMIREFNPFNLNKYFNCIVTASSTKLHKPNPEPVLKALELLNIQTEDTIYIGDSIYDMKSAKSAGISFGLAKWGAVNTSDLNEVDHYLDDPMDIMNLIK